MTVRTGFLTASALTSDETELVPVYDRRDNEAEQ